MALMFIVTHANYSSVFRITLKFCGTMRTFSGITCKYKKHILKETGTLKQGINSEINKERNR
jgi:hypothetical protein